VEDREAEVEKAKTEIAKEKEANINLKDTLSGLERTLTMQRDELDSVKVMLEERSNALSKLEDEFHMRVEKTKKDKAEVDAKAKSIEDKENSLKIERAALESLRAQLDSRSVELECKEKDLESKENTLVTREKERDASEEKLQELKLRAEKMKEESEARQRMLEKLEMALSKTEEALELQLQESASLEEQLKIATSRSEDLMLQLSKSTETIQTNNGSIASPREADLNEEKKVEESKPTASWPPKTQAEMQQLIDAELGKMIRQTEEEELEDPFEKEVVMALHQAAHKICYTKKYYDALKDEFIFFPSVARTIMNYDLMEEADKYYFDEEDELPIDVSAGLRSVASNYLDEDVDEEYMEAMAANVELPP
jgi:myosin protein heavy chain